MTCLSFPPDMRSRATCLRTTSYVLLQSKSSPLELCLSEFCTSCMIAVAYHISLGLNILDWSCKDMIAVALHDTVFVQNATSRHCQELPLELRTQTSGGGGETEGSSSVETEVFVTCLAWSLDGSVLALGTTQGEIQVVLMKHYYNMTCVFF